MNTYTLPFSAEEIENRLNQVEINKNDIESLSLGIIPDHSQYFDIDENGLISLKPEYRGLKCALEKEGVVSYSLSDNGPKIAGSSNTALPAHIYIPHKIGNKLVYGLQAGTFANNLQIQTITLHKKITALPSFIFYGANNLTSIENTEKIAALEKACFSYTAITSLWLPSLATSATGSCMRATYLEKVFLGNKITTLTDRMFYQCYSLTEVTGCKSVKVIENKCFYETRQLQNIDIPENVTLPKENQEDVFFHSSYQYNNKNYNTSDKLIPGHYLSTPPLIQLNQMDYKWASNEIGHTNLQYSSGCSYFSSMNVQAMLSNKNYIHPQQFINELTNNPNTTIYTTAEGALSKFNNLKTFWQESSPYRAIVLNNIVYKWESNEQCVDTNQSEKWSQEKYETLCTAISEGAIAIITVGKSLEHPDWGHYVVIYGLYKLDNQHTYMYILDSVGQPTDYKNPNNQSLHTYLMPFENITGPYSGCILIYPTKKEVDA